jgi:hypothetical protein
MGILGKVAKFETQRTFDTSTLSGTYQKVGAVYANPAVEVKIKNFSTVPVIISYDGVNDHETYAAGSGDVNDFGANAQSVSKDQRLAQAQGTQIWVKWTSAAAAGTGLITVSLVYASGSGV